MSDINLEIDKRYNKIATYELALAVLFSGCAVTLGMSQNVILCALTILNLGAFLTIVFRFLGRLYLCKDKASKRIYLVLIIVVFSAVLNISDISFAVSGRCILSLTLAVLLIFNFSTGIDAITAFVKVMRFYAICGVAFWIIFVVFNVSMSFLPTVTSASNASVEYKSLFIYSIMVGSDRNNGIFWEPSIFAGYLILSMFFSKFYLGYSKKKILVLLVALITTQSSGGILLLILFITCCVWENSSKSIFNNIVAKVLVIIAALAVVIFWDLIGQILLNINYDVFSKIFNLSTHGSSLTRLESARIDLAIWRSSPILGVGVDKMETMFLNLRDILGTITNMAHTSTSTEYLAAFGLGGLWINWLWISTVFSNRRSIIWKVLVLLSFFIVLNESPQINFTWTYFILFAMLRVRYEDANTVDTIEFIS